MVRCRLQVAYSHPYALLAQPTNTSLEIQNPLLKKHNPEEQISNNNMHTLGNTRRTLR